MTSEVALVLVEGIPGSGKTGTATRIAEWLGDHGLRVRLCLEGDPRHPADYESVARLTPAQWHALLEDHPTWRSVLREVAWRRGDEIFVPYGRLHEPAVELRSALARRDVYELPLADWQRLTLARWADFAQADRTAGDVDVFECCFLQNLLTTPIARFDQPADEACAHVLAIAGMLRHLHPLLVYLDPLSVADCLDAVTAERPREWSEFVIDYTTGQDWGRVRGVSGWAGMHRFYQELRDLQVGLLPTLASGGMRTLRLSDPARDWPAAHARLAAELGAAFGPGDSDPAEGNGRANGMATGDGQEDGTVAG